VLAAIWIACFLAAMLAAWRKRRLDGPNAPVERPVVEHEPHPRVAVTALAAAYAVFTVWTFVAWYRKHYPLSKYKWGGDGWLGPSTYAGGADKFGHAWATMALARLGTVLLADVGGFARRRASLLSAGLSELLFTGVEVKDGFYYEFSFSDLTGDTIGAILAALLDNVPRLRRLVAYRVEYLPSEMYRRKVDGTSPCPSGGCSRWNVAEDYSGQTYLLAFHLAGIPVVRNKLGVASRFVDAAIGFDSRNYKPTPDADVTERPHQDLFVGLAINAQGIIDALLEDATSTPARVARTVGRGLFEVFNLPYGSIRLLEASRERPERRTRPISSPRRPPWHGLSRSGRR
jgi:hypothetical protein